MIPKDEDLPALRELESAVISVWAQKSEMNDYAAGRAYESAFQYYRSRLRNQEPKPPTLTGLDLETFRAVEQACERLLAAGPKPIKGTSKAGAEPVSLEKLVAYLRRLVRSVELHTKRAGRHGYLEFVRDFVK